MAPAAISEATGASLVAPRRTDSFARHAAFAGPFDVSSDSDDV